MGMYEYTVRKMCEEQTKDELAEKVLTYMELANMYKKDNDMLRQANESLMYLIAKYNIETE